ncbi:hypothetical protein ACLX1H_005909 [Fusarium chlamydosporum]
MLTSWQLLVDLVAAPLEDGLLILWDGDALTAAFLGLDLAGKLSPLHYTIPVGVSAVFLLVSFYYVEKYYAQEPIIPMNLLVKRDVYIPYLLVALQTAAQFIVGQTLGRLGMGSTQSTTFVHLVAALDAKDLAVAGTTWFLCQSAGMLIAANVFNMVHNLALTSMLGSALEGVADKSKIIDGVSSSVEYIKTLPADLREIVKKVVVQTLVPTND